MTIFGLRTKFFLTYVAIVAVALVILNIYPPIQSRELVFVSKRTSLMAQAATIGNSLEALEKVSYDGVKQVVDLLDTSGLTDVTVVNPEGREIYFESGLSHTGGEEESRVISLALEGKNSFLSTFDDGVFYSYACVPIMSRSMVVGAVCVYERDTEQGDIIIGLRDDMLKISVAVCFLALVLSLIFSGTISYRIRRVLDAIQTVREGEYNYRINVRGHDELARLSEEFNSLTDRLQSNEEIRRRFVADASHELKTPLASIRLLSDSIVQNENMDRKTMLEFVNDIGGEAERLAHTTEELLTLTRLDNASESGRVAVDVGQMASRAMRVLLPIAAEKGVTLSFTLAENCVISAAEDDIYRVVLNVVENAIKYNYDDGSVNVTLENDGENAVLMVDDTGFGIPEEDLPHIFDRFYRVDKARSREMGGSGLGLSIVYSIVRSFDGDVTAVNREEGGMRFTITFPLYSESGPEQTA